MGRGEGTFSNSKTGRAGQKKIKIIVADDDQDVLDTLTTLLEEKGISVIGKAYDGEEASQQYFLLKPDVILLDMSMPNYDGNYAIEKIKLKDPNAKIIVITAYLDEYFPADKVLGVFSKPAEIDKLVKKIRHIASSGTVNSKKK